MLKISATEIKNRLGQYMDSAVLDPIVVEKSGRPFVVILSYSEYERLNALEDAYWAERVKQAEAGGFLGVDESMALLKAALDAKS
jgi:prevent-host-death family protein